MKVSDASQIQREIEVEMCNFGVLVIYKHLNVKRKAVNQQWFWIPTPLVETTTAPN